MGVELIERVGIQLITAIHKERREARLGRCILRELELVFLARVGLLNRLFNQPFDQIFVLHFV
jgi:hypothetical protein